MNFIELHKKNIMVDFMDDGRVIFKFRLLSQNFKAFNNIGEYWQYECFSKEEWELIKETEKGKERGAGGADDHFGNLA